MGKFVRDYGLSVVLAALFVVSWVLQALTGWVDFASRQEAHGEAAFPGSGKRPGTEDELVRLRRENARLREERDILKKATAFFAKQSR